MAKRYSARLREGQAYQCMNGSRSRLLKGIFFEGARSVELLCADLVALATKPTCAASFVAGLVGGRDDAFVSVFVGV